MRISILTLFPRALRPFLRASILGRAQDAGLLRLDVLDLRDQALDRHRTADDTPYGGGPGMVLKAEPVVRAVRAVRTPESKVILMSPQGEKFGQTLAKELAGEKHLILVCGHYRGLDERARDLVVDREISVGDYVLSGGEAAALVVADAVGRTVPGVVGDAGSAEADSFMDGDLDHASYTRPEEFEGLRVPEALLSGDHARIQAYRNRERRERTLSRRPDLPGGGRK